MMRLARASGEVSALAPTTELGSPAFAEFTISMSAEKKAA